MLERIRFQPDQRLAFLQGFLRRPGQVASVIPSSRFLERRVVVLSRAARARLVVELGPGTGGTTRALLRALPPTSTLLAIEIEPRFAELLRCTPDPRLLVEIGSAERLAGMLAARGLASPDAIVSGIPFSRLDRAVGRRILESIRAALAPGGRFVAYQVRDRVQKLAEPLFGASRVEVELRNLPPLRVYAWRKPGPSGSRRLERPGATRAPLA
jgi:phospholipid N-methyltransferase